MLPNDDAKTRGIAVGQAAAAAIIANRSNDGSTNSIQYQPTLLPGIWRPTRPDYLPAHSPHWGNVRLFAIANAADFAAPPPSALTSPQYADDYNEVKALGEVFLHTRTPEETQIAYFWADPAGSVSPPGHWNLIAADMIVNHSLDDLSAARTMALLNMALADAAIVCWHNKYADELWRPITAINLGDTDGHDDTIMDQFWTPLLLSPRFPEHVRTLDLQCRRSPSARDSLWKRCLLHHFQR